MTAKVTLYIPCHNAAAHLSFCLDSVFAQDYSIDEVLVIDDGSTDDTVKVATHYAVRVVRHAKNRGLSAARNTAFEAARNPLVAALDADCVPERDWLGRLVAPFSDPNVAATGGRLIETKRSTLADRWREAHMSQHWGPRPIVNPEFMFGNNLVARKGAVVDVGGYDEHLRTNGEDADLSGRLLRKGYTCLYLPDAVVSHLRQDTVRSILDTYWRYWRFGARAYFNGVSAFGFFHCLYRHHFKRSFANAFRGDLGTKRWELLGIDVALLFYMPFRDLQLWASQAKARRGEMRGVSSEA